MSKAQGDGYRTWTNKGLNDYYTNVFLPAFVKMENEIIKVYKINGGKIQCEQKNVVECDGWKLKGLKLTGKKEFRIRVYNDENSMVSDSVFVTSDKDEANEKFLYWKMQLSI